MRPLTCLAPLLASIHRSIDEAIARIDQPHGWLSCGWSWRTGVAALPVCRFVLVLGVAPPRPGRQGLVMPGGGPQTRVNCSVQASCQGHAVGRCRVSRRAEVAMQAGTPIKVLLHPAIPAWHPHPGRRGPFAAPKISAERGYFFRFARSLFITKSSSARSAMEAASASSLRSVCAPHGRSGFRFRSNRGARWYRPLIL
jgi:hypothetical protein